MNRQYRRLTKQPPVDMKETYKWLEAANFPAATEGLVVAAQDKVLRTRYYERKILASYQTLSRRRARFPYNTTTPERVWDHTAYFLHLVSPHVI